MVAVARLVILNGIFSKCKKSVETKSTNLLDKTSQIKQSAIKKEIPRRKPENALNAHRLSHQRSSQ